MSRSFLRRLVSVVSSLVMSSVMSVERGTSNSLSYRMFLSEFLLCIMIVYLSTHLTHFTIDF